MAACWYGIARTATVDRAGAWVEIDEPVGIAALRILRNAPRALYEAP